MQRQVGNRWGSAALGGLASGGLLLALLGGPITQSCAQRQIDTTPGPGLGYGQGMPWGGRRGPSDQQFMVMMVPHHEEAIAMAELALVRARRAEIKELARSIKASQSRENEQMRRWYQQWYGQSLPSWPAGTGWGWHHGGMRGGMGAGMGGMGTGLQALRQASDFDRTFLEQMIPHHQMGVMMATMERNSSERPEMRQLADEMIRVQGDEIRTMQQWYRNWYP